MRQCFKDVNKNAAIMTSNSREYARRQAGYLLKEILNAEIGRVVGIINKENIKQDEIR